MRTKEFKVTKHFISKRELASKVEKLIKKETGLDIGFSIEPHPDDNNAFIAVPVTKNPLDYPDLIERIKEKGFFTPGSSMFSTQVIGLLLDVKKPNVEHKILYSLSNDFEVVVSVWEEIN